MRLLASPGRLGQPGRLPSRSRQPSLLRWRWRPPPAQSRRPRSRTDGDVRGPHTLSRVFLPHTPPPPHVHPASLSLSLSLSLSRMWTTHSLTPVFLPHTPPSPHVPAFLSVSLPPTFPPLIPSPLKIQMTTEPPDPAWAAGTRSGLISALRTHNNS